MLYMGIKITWRWCKSRHFIQHVSQPKWIQALLKQIIKDQNFDDQIFTVLLPSTKHRKLIKTGKTVFYISFSQTWEKSDFLNAVTASTLEVKESERQCSMVQLDVSFSSELITQLHNEYSLCIVWLQSLAGRTKNSSEACKGYIFTHFHLWHLILVQLFF